ncbi:3-oxoadipate enol-lactonase [Streptomyces glaucescens]|uniref:alpha/beta fold hydrolase n=1 Tax=Streptomyces sp. SAI-170 TaxID=3377729 RepID=UPI003C7A670E
MKDGGAELLYATAPDGATIAAEILEPVGTAAGTLLLVPGLGYGPWSFAPQRADLALDHRLVMLHNRGTGASDAPPGPYSVEVMADDAAAVLRAVGSDRTHVVGTSMGGYISLWLAQAHPELVGSLVVIASSPGGPGAFPVPSQTTTLWRDHARLSAEEFARQTMPHSFAPGWTEAHNKEYATLLASRLSSPTARQAWDAQSSACEDFLQRGLPDAGPHQPVTCIHGTADRVVPFENLAAFSQRLPHARLVTLPGAGHLCWLEHPHDVNRIIRDHLARIGVGAKP